MLKISCFIGKLNAPRHIAKQQEYNVIHYMEVKTYTGFNNQNYKF